MRESIDNLLANPSNMIGVWYKIFGPMSDKISFRKISYFADKEGKTRVIAILDYWSQTVLKPLHDHISMVLKGISTDCTFNQNHFQTCLPTSGPYFSFDLSNATDRMPLWLQEHILTFVVGEEKAKAWSRILTK